MSGDRRHAVVTGGSRGFGRALCLELAARGWVVHATGRDEASLRELDHEARDLPGTIHTHRSDVTSSEDNATLAASVAATGGSVRALVHNAGLLGPPRTMLAEYPPAEFQRVMAANVFGPFDLTRQLLPSLHRGSALYFVSSGASLAPRRGWGAYNVSKIALDGLAGIWALELMEREIRVVIVDPGKMRTSMRAAAYPEEDPMTLETPEAKARRMVQLMERPASVRTGARVDL